MCPKKNYSHAARRARTAQRAGSTVQYTALLRSGKPEAPVWTPAPGRYAGPEWTEFGNPFIPPAGTSPAEDPYGRAYDCVAVPFLLTAVVPEELEGWQDGRRVAAAAVQAACRFLVRDGRWYRAKAEVFGPLPVTMPLDTDEPAPPGYTTATWMVSLAVRRPWDDPALLIGDAHTAILAELARRVSCPPGHQAQWFPLMDPAQASAIVERVPVHALVRDDVHPSLLPGADGQFGRFIHGFPARLVDAHSQGWFHAGDGLYRADFGEQRGLTETDFDILAGTRGPLDPVVDPYPGSEDEIGDALRAAGRRAVASLLVALHRIDAEQQSAAEQWGATVTTLYAGAESSWETEEMRVLVRTLGPLLAADEEAYDSARVTELIEIIEGWVEVMGSYTEVAANLASLVTSVAESTGGWLALAGDRLNPGHADALPGAGELRAWLMSASDFGGSTTTRSWIS